MAHHTPTPGTVALVGSLQSELGCPGDWQPECAATRLQPVAGSPGLFRATFDVPAGSYEYKVALNDAWDENYGAGGAPGGANIPINAPGGPITFTYDHATHVIGDDVPRPLAATPGAHWLRRGVIAWQPPAGAESFRLHSAPEGGLKIEDGAIAGGASVPLTLDGSGLPAALRAAYPHLAGYAALDVPAEARRDARSLLTGELVVAAYDGAGNLLQTTGVQIPGVLDDLYARAPMPSSVPADPARCRARRLGAHRQARRPPARPGRSARRAAHPDAPRRRRRVACERRRRAGATRRYLYEAAVYVPTLDRVVANAVTDPYSLALTTNSRRSVLVDLDDRKLQPDGWQRLRKPALDQPEDSTIYELHVRDFSITDETVPAAHRGTFLAFTDRHSDGMRHLRDLARSGLNTLHVLPANDIATIEEDRSAQQQPPCDLPSFPPGLADAAGVRHRRRRARRVQLGLRPAALHRAGGLLRDRPGGRRTHAAVPARWCRASTAPGCAWSWTWSTTTRRPRGRTRSRSWTGSCRATTTGSTPPAARSRRPRAARTPRPST